MCVLCGDDNHQVIQGIANQNRLHMFLHRHVFTEQKQKNQQHMLQIKLDATVDETSVPVTQTPTVT